MPNIACAFVQNDHELWSRSKHLTYLDLAWNYDDGRNNNISNCIHRNHIALQLKLKKQLVYNYCATIPWYYNYYATIPLKI